MLKNNPEITNRTQSFFSMFLNSLRFIHMIGNRNKLASSIRYILNTVAGASDHFTKIAEKEMAIIEIMSGTTILFEPFV